MMALMTHNVGPTVKDDGVDAVAIGGDGGLSMGLGAVSAVTEPTETTIGRKESWLSFAWTESIDGDGGDRGAVDEPSSSNAIDSEEFRLFQSARKQDKASPFR